MIQPRFQVQDTELQGLNIVQRRIFEDPRGHFSRLFCAEALKEAGFPTTISQINHSLTKQSGTVRGLHFQHPPHTEIKEMGRAHV